MRKRIAVLSLVALVAVVVAGVFIGPSIANANAANVASGGSGWVLGRGTVGTPDSEIARGYKFWLKARVHEDGSARGAFAARVHLRDHGDSVTDQARRIVGIRARFNEGTLGEKHAKLVGTANVHLADGEVLTDLPFQLGVRLGERGEYGMVLHIGDRLLEGKGVAGDVIIFHNRSDVLAHDEAAVVR